MSRECRTIEGLLSPYLDGELTGDQTRRCAQHLAECADCRRELERLELARSVLQAMSRPEAPPHLAALIKSSLADSQRPVASVFWPAWATPVAAAATLVVALSVGLLRGPDAPAPDSHLASAPAPVGIIQPLMSDDVSPVAVAVAPDEPAGEVAVASLVRAAERRATPRHAGFASRAAVVVEAAEVIAPSVAVATSEPGFAFGVATDEDRSVEVALAGPTASPVDETLEIALAPRLSPVAGDIGAPAAPVGPSDFERELASGVVASLLVDDFVAEHLIESAPTMLSVVTATPSAELGLRLAEGEDEARFELCFTEAMRRALAGVGE
jgi:predicted anti-sigma-YlaC factor YlaD